MSQADKVALHDASQATSNISIEDMMSLIANAPPGNWPQDWHSFANTKEAFRQLAIQQINSTEKYPSSRFAGKGIVIAGGGIKYFPGVWVCIKSLRESGCNLPIEVWYLGNNEMDPVMIRILETLDVKCVDAHKLEDMYPVRILAGWELKLYAIKQCRFEEVLFLDADNFALLDPTFLFEEKDYEHFGAMFWPDYGNWMLKPDVWQTFGMTYRHEPAIESGQILINKKKCWKETCLAMWYGEFSDYVFKHVYGDKECFHLAWRRCDTYYAIPPIPPGWHVHTIVQHDVQGRHLFHHRCQDKLRLDGKNRWLTDMTFEKERQSFLAQLRSQWSGYLWKNSKPNHKEFKVITELTNSNFLYRRVGYDERKLELRSENKIGAGSDANERRWEIHEIDGKITLTICGGSEPTCHLLQDDDKIWRGSWLKHEKMPIELLPLDTIKVSKDTLIRKVDRQLSVGIDLDKIQNNLDFFVELANLFKAIGHRIILISGHKQDCNFMDNIIREYGKGFYDKLLDGSLKTIDETIEQFKNRISDENDLDILLDEKALRIK